MIKGEVDEIELAWGKYMLIWHVGHITIIGYHSTSSHQLSVIRTLQAAKDTTQLLSTMSCRNNHPSVHGLKRG